MNSVQIFIDWNAVKMFLQPKIQFDEPAGILYTLWYLCQYSFDTWYYMAILRIIIILMKYGNPEESE